MTRETAQEILNQLGGNHFIAMTGAKNIAYGKSLSMKIGRNAKHVTHITICLNSLDLYDVEYLKCSVKGRQVVASVDNIYGDQLRNNFEQQTGLYTHL